MVVEWNGDESGMEIEMEWNAMLYISWRTVVRHM